MDIPKGSKMRILWKISYPMMLSWLSTVLMIFIDRLFLSYYSTQALTAAISASTMAWALTYSFQTLGELFEVHIAQHNGAGHKKELGPLCNQMLWLSLTSVIFFTFSAYLGSYLYSHSVNGLYKSQYFFYLVICGPIHGLLGSMIAFFVGQGKTFRVTQAFALGNVLNLILDPWFIFGGSFLPAMGTKGAAIATALGILGQTLFLSYHYLKKQQHLNCRTWDFSFSFDKLKGLLFVATPPAFFTSIEIFAWAFFYILMEYLSPLHILVTGVCQTLLIILFFFAMGIQKGISALAGNLIGQRRLEEIKQLVYSACRLTTLFFLLTAALAYSFSQSILSIFFQNDPDTFSQIYPLLLLGLAVVIVYTFLESLRCLFLGLLTATGDTFFLLWSGVFSLWMFMLVPTLLAIYLKKASIETCLSIWIFYALMAFLLPMYRFYSNGWKKHKNLILKDH